VHRARRERSRDVAAVGGLARRVRQVREQIGMHQPRAVGASQHGGRELRTTLQHVAGVSGSVVMLASRSLVGSIG